MAPQNWFLVCKDMFKLFVIYDAVFFETTYHAQCQPFNLVTLDADLQQYLQDWMSHINVKKDQVGPAQPVVHNLVSRCPHQQRFFHCMLLLQDCNKIHEDFIEATDFLGKMY